MVDFVRKYAPDYAKNVVPVLSPVLTHTKILRQTFGDEIGVVFFGPCVAKKNESDRHQELLDLALTFADLEEWLTEEGIDPASINPSDYQNMVPESAEDPPVSRLRRGFFWYPIECALCHLYPTLMRRPRPLSDLKISGRIKYNYHRNKELPLCQRKSSVESTVFRLFKLSH